MDEKTVLITGANGFLGRAISSLLLVSGVCVRATDLGATSCGVSDILYRKADITRLEEIRPVLDTATIVIHAAGLTHNFIPDVNSIEKLRQINEIGTANVASATAWAGAEHLILISSVSVYGLYTEGIYDENTPCNPFGVYALSKYNAELRAVEIAKETGLALTILRLSTLYGEDDPGNVAHLIRSLDRGRFMWIGAGKNRKSLLYKEDAARACMAVIGRPASGINIYNVSGPACAMREIVDCIASTLEKRPCPVQIPASLVLFLARKLSRVPNRRMSALYYAVQKWLSEDIYDTHRFDEAYDFQTETSLEDGLKREVDWYQCNKKAGRIQVSHNLTV